MTGPPAVRQIRHFPAVDSTNARALAWAAEGAPDGSAVVAREQTAGRGRRGRTWHSPEGGLYLSYVVRDMQRFPRPSLVTLAAGVAAVRAIRQVAGLDTRLKWPNDVLAPDSALKLAGILAEGSTTGSRLEWVIVGVGINVTPGSVPPDLRARATSLELELGRLVDIAALQDALLAALDAAMAALRGGGHAALLRDWMALAPAARGARISWRTAEGESSGVTAGVDEDGALLVTTGAGLQRLVAGEVVWT